MLLHILKKDLKRKKTMNVILLIFIIMAATFLASSVNNLITITGAVDQFLELAKTPDRLIVVTGTETKTDMDDFLGSSDSVEEYDVSDVFILTDENIRILECTNEPGKEQYDKGNTLSVGAVPKNFMKVFDEAGKPLVLKSGEIALPRVQAERNNLQVGDKIQITYNGITQDYTVATIAKDAVFGTEMMGFKRLFLSQADYDKFMEAGTSESFHTLLYSINYSDESQFKEEYKNYSFQIISNVDKATIKMCYIFDMLIAAILIIVSICLILIAFLILRFTIVFTIQEDYKEIGIMKAIGIKDISIKGIYMLKYFAIAVLGACIGLFLSFPFQKILLSKAIINIVAENVKGNVIINVLCAVVVVLIVLMFCYLSAGKVKKISAIEAIRRGSNGERYHAKASISLHKRKHMLPGIYLAWNDIFSHVRQYLVLAVIFCIGTLLILLPLTAMHTLNDDSVIRNFSMQEADVFLDNRKLEKYVMEKNDSLIRSDIEEIEQQFASNGLVANVWVEIGYTMPCYGSNPEELYNFYTVQQIGKAEDDYDLLSGRIPELTNEIMITEKTAATLEVEIGDSVYFQCGERTEEFIITGLYQSMINMGDGFRVSKSAKIDYSYISGVFAMEAQVDGDFSAGELKEKVQEIFPDYVVHTPSEFANSMNGGSMDKLDALKLLIMGMVLVINVLITVLMMKTLITREHGEIAMLKSVGFPSGTLRCWQSVRIILILCMAILAGTGLSKVLAPLTIAPIFAMMGATSIKLITEPIEAYVIIPLVLIMTTGLAAYLCSAEVKKVDLKEINTLE